MLFPIRTDTPLRRTPYANYTLIALNVVCFIAQMSVSEAKWSPLMLHPRDPQIWQYITYQFLHHDVLHIAGNMLFLYVFGGNVCDKIGGIGYVGFYLAGGVMAGVAQVASSGAPYAPTLGASGSISAITGAYLALLPRSHVTVVYWIIIIGTYDLAGVWFVLMYFAWDLIQQFSSLTRFGAGGGGGVAYMAHIGGTIFGFLMCMCLLWMRLLPRDMYDMLALWDRANRRRQYRDVVSGGYDPFGYAPREPVVQRQPHVSDRIQDLRAQISEELAHHKVEQAAKLYLELRAVDPNQVLSRQAQLDVSNQLFAQQTYGSATEAYELYLRHYPKADQIENVHLICGIIYGRYLQRYDKAKEHLEAAMPKLTAPRDVELAKTELARVTPLVASG